MVGGGIFGGVVFDLMFVCVFVWDFLCVGGSGALCAYYCHM